MNLARNKPTKQSSTAYNGHPERAVDGNRNDDYNRSSCTHTDDRTPPWWRVDLQKVVSVPI